MNESAKKLALGNYDADFSGNGYREINELADTLNYASRELAKTDRLQKELISNISHDLRTPLTMIKGYSEMMRDIPDENTPENVQIIIDETSRLSDLVNDMLDLSKIQAGTRKPDRQIFSLTATVRDTMQRYERLMMQENYKIEFVAREEAEVCADRGMILQVIYNLINNAINYTGEDKRVSVRQERVGDRVRISVTDTGTGIAKEEIPMIWDRYYKVDKVHKRAKIGTGLGLSIVKGILESHGAAYGVESKVGEGSNFWFELETFRAVEEFDTDDEKDK
jgi:signal transduction histidine kinase